MTDRMLIYIPNEGNYIEILGHKIDGFDSFESFCEYLKKYAELEETVNRQQAEISELQHKIMSCNSEIERLQKENHYFADIGKMYSEIRAEAYKECIEKIKEISEKETYCDNRLPKPIRTYHIIEDELDNLLKELVGEG